MGTLKGLGKEEVEEEQEGGRGEGGRDEWDRLIHKHTCAISPVSEERRPGSLPPRLLRWNPSIVGLPEHRAILHHL